MTATISSGFGTTGTSLAAASGATLVTGSGKWTAEHIGSIVNLTVMCKVSALATTGTLTLDLASSLFAATGGVKPPTTITTMVGGIGVASATSTSANSGYTTAISNTSTTITVTFTRTVDVTLAANADVVLNLTYVA